MTRRTSYAASPTGLALPRSASPSGDPLAKSRRDYAPFAWLRFEAELHDLDVDAAGRLVLDDPPSRYVLDEFTLRRQQGASFSSLRDRDGPPLTAQMVRTIPVDRVIGEVLYAFGIEDDAEPEPEQAVEAAHAGIRDEAALRLVARLYLRTSLSGGSTGADIASWLDCSPATAIRWVAAAKDAGFLEVADTRRR